MKCNKNFYEKNLKFIVVISIFLHTFAPRFTIRAYIPAYTTLCCVVNCFQFYHFSTIASRRFTYSTPWDDGQKTEDL